LPMRRLTKYVLFSKESDKIRLSGAFVMAD
jgi:hypothetical protein